MEPSAVRAGIPMVMPDASEGEESATSLATDAEEKDEQPKEEAEKQAEKEAEQPKEEVRQEEVAEGSVAKRMRIHGPGNGSEQDSLADGEAVDSLCEPVNCAALRRLLQCRAAWSLNLREDLFNILFRCDLQSLLGGDTQELEVMYRALPVLKGKSGRRYSGAKQLTDDDCSAPRVCRRAHKQGLSPFEATRGLFSMDKIVKELGRAALPIADLDIVHAAPVLQNRRHPDKPCLERLVKDRDACYQELACSREAPTFSNCVFLLLILFFCITPTSLRGCQESLQRLDLWRRRPPLADHGDGLRRDHQPILERVLGRATGHQEAGRRQSPSGNARAEAKGNALSGS